MIIFNTRPQGQDALMKYYEEIIRDLKQTNYKYKLQNDFLRARVKKLEWNTLYHSVPNNPIKLLKENVKLKKSLRKLYEKYIKPTQGMKLHTSGKPIKLDVPLQSTDLVSKSYEDTLSITQSPVFLKMQEEAVAENKKVWKMLTLHSQGKRKLAKHSNNV